MGRRKENLSKERFVGSEGAHRGHAGERLKVGGSGKEHQKYPQRKRRAREAAREKMKRNIGSARKECLTASSRAEDRIDEEGFLVGSLAPNITARSPTLPRATWCPGGCT
jgi:hypothetical protein